MEGLGRCGKSVMTYIIDRERIRVDTINTNHGGVTAVASPGVRLSLLDLGVNPGTFELLCVRIISGSSACVVAIVYRPESECVSSPFFGEISDVLDRLVTFVDPVYLVDGIKFVRSCRL